GHASASISPSAGNCELARILHLSGERPLQLAEEAFVFAPSFMNCDMKVEKDSCPQDRLELHARLGADALDHLGVLPDHDRLLRFSLDEDRRVDLDQVFFFVLFPAFY